MNWADSEDIAEALEKKHPDENILALRFTKLHQMIIELDDFDDIAEKSNEKILESILVEWLEIRKEK